MSWIRIGRSVRAIRLRLRLRQSDVAARARVSRSSISLLERGFADRLSVATIEAIAAALGARLATRLTWHGPDLDRLLDADHAALQAAVKRRLERWGWLVRVEVSFNRYGERGRIDLLAWHPLRRVLLVVEIKTDLVDTQALLGAMDLRVRLAPMLARGFGWDVQRVVPAIVFLDDRTTRRRLAAVDTLFDRYALRGRAAISWLRQPIEPVTGLLWVTKLTTARVVRIGHQRVYRRRCDAGP